MTEGINKRGDFAEITLLEDRTLTGTFTDNESEAYQLAPNIQLELEFSYTMDGAETSNTAVTKVLLSDDGVNYQEYCVRQDGSPSGGIVLSSLHKMRFVVSGTAGVQEDRMYAIQTTAAYFKVQAMETGIAANGGLFTLKARLRNVNSHDH
jgi:hypothetical protein